MKPDERDDAAAFFVLVVLGLLLLMSIGAGAYFAFARYADVAGGM